MLVAWTVETQVISTPAIAKLTDDLNVSILDRKANLEHLHNELEESKTDSVSVTLYFDAQGWVNRTLTRKEKALEAIAQESQRLTDEQNKLDLVSQGVSGISKIIEDLTNLIESRQNLILTMQKEIEKYKFHTSIAFYQGRNGQFYSKPSRKQELAELIANEQELLSHEILERNALFQDMQVMQSFQLNEQDIEQFIYR